MDQIENVAGNMLNANGPLSLNCNILPYNCCSDVESNNQMVNRTEETEHENGIVRLKRGKTLIENDDMDCVTSL